MFPEVVREARGLMVAHPESTRWGLRLLVVIDEPSFLAGLAGFKGRPRDGIVEIRYAVAAGMRCRGIASAAVRALVRDAFADPGVGAVVAHTDPFPNPSARVLT